MFVAKQINGTENIETKENETCRSTLQQFNNFNSPSRSDVQDCKKGSFNMKTKKLFTWVRPCEVNVYIYK